MSSAGQSPSAGSFTEWLRDRSRPDWDAVLAHPFTDALFAGTVPDDAMRSYLVQDYQFVDEFLALLGAAIARADRYPSRLAIAGCVAVITSEENTYFHRAFDALGVDDEQRRAPELEPTTVAFRELMADTNERGTYPDVLTVLLVAEWTYLEWASRAPAQLPANFVHAEWISLHNDAGFREWVGWLRAELDRVGGELDEREQARCLRLFQLAVRYELDFFNAHWK